MRVVELYCGIGGGAAALQTSRPDAEVVGAFDISAPAIEVYRHNFPGHPAEVRLIESLPAERLKRLEADLFWLSPPCQPHTRRGLRRDLQDPRSVTFLAALELIAACRPQWVALENVAGFEESEARDRLLDVLADAGYGAPQERLLCPSELGWPNRRLRFYLLAGPLPPAPLSADGEGGEPREGASPPVVASEDGRNHRLPSGTPPGCGSRNGEPGCSCRGIKTQGGEPQGVIPFDLSGPTKAHDCPDRHSGTAGRRGRGLAPSPDPHPGGVPEGSRWLRPSSDATTGRKDPVLGSPPSPSAERGAGGRGPEISPRPRLADLLDPTPEPGLDLSTALSERYAAALDRVDPADPAAVASCFTSAYGRSPVRAGSYLLRPDGGLRHFSPAEVLRLLGFPTGFAFPPEISRQLAWRLAGNSLSLPAVQAVLASLPASR
jgi:site-specific DNA-cytosine methylase